MEEITIHFPKEPLTPNYTARVREANGESVVEFLEGKTVWQQVKNWFGRYVYSGEWSYKTSNIHCALMKTRAQWESSEAYTMKQKNEVIQWIDDSVQCDQNSRIRKWHDPALKSCQSIKELSSRVLAWKEREEKVKANAIEIIRISKMPFDPDRMQLLFKLVQENFTAALQEANVKDVTFTWKRDNEGFEEGMGITGITDIPYDPYPIEKVEMLEKAIGIFQKPFHPRRLFQVGFARESALEGHKLAIEINCRQMEAT